MNDLHSPKDYYECDLLTVEGQISFLLLDNDLPAGELYSNVKASQPDTACFPAAAAADSALADFFLS